MNAVEIEYKCNYKNFIRFGCDYKKPTDIGNPCKCEWYYGGHCTNGDVIQEAIKED